MGKLARKVRSQPKHNTASKLSAIGQRPKQSNRMTPNHSSSSENLWALVILDVTSLKQEQNSLT